jgi:hypothetical protein
MPDALGSALPTFSTDQLLQAYQGQLNPLNTTKRLALPGQAAVQAELQKRGVDTSQINVVPSGKVLHNTGLKSVGQAIGGVLKVAAPIAALAIPGLGPIAAGALAAGGNVLGNTLQGKNTLKSIPGAALGGVAVGAGRGLLNKAIGGGYGGGTSAPTTGGGLAAVGNAGSAAGGGGGLGGTLQGIGQGLGVIGQNGQLNPLRLAQLGLGAAGVVQGAQAQGRANDALGRAVAPVNVPMPNLSPIFAGEAQNNPYWNQSGPNGAQLAAIRALQAR